MPTPAYTPYDSSKPDGSHTPTVVIDTEVIGNERALRDYSITGPVKSFIQTRTTGSGADATHPQFITWMNGTLGYRLNMTWTGDKVTGITPEWSNDTGATWVAMSTAQVNTFDGSYNITASTNSGGFFNILLEVWAKCLKVVADLLTHTAATGTAVHGLGTASTQNTASFPATGTSTLDGTGGVGQTTAPPVDATRVREKFNAYAQAAAAGTTTLEMDKYGHFSGQPSTTTTDTWTIAISGSPASGKSQSGFLEIINGRRSADGKITYPASWHWIGGAAARPNDTALELSGRDLFSFVTHDGGTTYDVQWLGKRG